MKKFISLSLILSLTLLITACTIPNPFKRAETPIETENVQMEETSDSLTDSFKGKLTDLFALNQNLECQVVNNNTVSGTTYVSGKNMRGDYLIALDPDDTTKVMESHIVSDGETFYIWSSGLPTGLKMSAQDWTEEDTDASETDNTDALKTDFEYDCKPWAVEEDKLAVPADISFVDLGNTFDGVKGMGCSACEMISDPTAQLQCKAKLGC